MGNSEKNQSIILLIMQRILALLFFIKITFIRTSIMFMRWIVNFIRFSHKGIVYTNNKAIITEPNVNLKSRVVNEVIEEINKTFYTEVDKLLASAKITNDLNTDKQLLIDKYVRLKALGFKNTKEVKEAEIEIERLDTLKKGNEEKQELIEAINFFSITYPTYKFITEDSVKNICQKYGLVYYEISRYLGTVPDKILKYIEHHNIHDDHRCFYSKFIFFSYNGLQIISNKYSTKKEHDAINKKDKTLSMYRSKFSLKCPLEIVAPVEDFDMTGIDVISNKNHKNHKNKMSYPIILIPVIFSNKKHYLIVTALEKEGSDEIVVNQQVN